MVMVAMKMIMFISYPEMNSELRIKASSFDYSWYGQLTSSSFLSEKGQSLFRSN